MTGLHSAQPVLLVFAFVLFVLAGLGFPTDTGRYNLIGLGLACWVGSLFL